MPRERPAQFALTKHGSFKQEGSGLEGSGLEGLGLEGSGRDEVEEGRHRRNWREQTRSRYRVNYRGRPCSSVCDDGQGLGGNGSCPGRSGHRESWGQRGVPAGSPRQLFDRHVPVLHRLSYGVVVPFL